MSRPEGIEFAIFLEGGLALKVLVNPSLQNRDVIDCLHVLENSLNVAEKQGFDDYGVYNWEIDGRAIQIQRL